MVVGGRELIDTLWNVNEKELEPLSKESKELIDTLWNVNDNIADMGLRYDLELIDTLWNVNFSTFINVFIRRKN